MVISSSCCHSNFWTLGQFHQKFKSPARLEKTAGDRGQSDCAHAITTRKNWAQPLLYGSGSNHMLGTSRKAAFICPIAHRANCFIDIHFWWPQRGESSSFFLFKECTLMLLLSGIVPAPTWPPCWALLDPPSWLCLCTAPPKDSWAPLPIVFALSRETFLLPQSLVVVHPLSAVDGLQLIHPPPSEISTTTKNSGMRQLICIISIGGLKTKSFCNNFPVRTTETIVRQKT